MWSYWNEEPVPMYMKVYLFNVTSSEEVMSRQAVPIVEELGPYTYSNVHLRVNIEKYDNATQKIHQERYWKFLPELSNGSLTDQIISVNPAVAVTCQSTYHLIRVLLSESCVARIRAPPTA